MIVWYLAVVCCSVLAVVMLREIRAELWDRSIERERDSERLREHCQRVVEIHEQTRSEIMRCDAEAVSEALNREIREMSLPDWCRFQVDGAARRGPQ